ncbi:MAG: glycosyltransferase family 2 protein [Lachnospiraceae bacterium]|nr:glycosyltransferase family 2 protein [Lachnospiraceae bacterium]
MKAGKPIRISQCMIVKNEEKNIERALTWGKQIMWEQIVVDTGSEDQTAEIAEKMGAKVCVFPWIDDFAAAKNYAICQAKGDWIAFLDADEYMNPQDARKLPGILEQLSRRGLEALSTGWQQLDDEGQIFSSGTQIRVFRNDPKIRYRRRIHEQLEAAGGRELRVGNVVQELSIFHEGYQTKALKGKSGRNRRLIQEELKEHPGDYEMMGYMGDEYRSDGESKEAVRWYRSAIDHMPSTLKEYDQRSAATFTYLLRLLSEEKGISTEELQMIYDKAVHLLPKEADFDYIMGRFFAAQEQPDQAVWYLEKALRKLDTYGCSNRALLLAGNLQDAYDLLVRCYYGVGNMQACVNCAVTYLKYDRYGMGVLSRLLMALLPGEGTRKEYEAVSGFLAKLYDMKDIKDRIFLIKAAELSGRMGLHDFLLRSILTQEERKGLGL